MFDNDFIQKYSIDVPPPTVSGVLHMGHVFSYCHADFIARYKKLTGKEVFYPIGFDDNGLPTERLTEKVKSVSGPKMMKEGRLVEFKALCKEVTTEAEIEFENLFKAIGFDMDFENKKYQTISNNVKDIAYKSFEDLKNKNLIYKSASPTYWCCTDQTTLAQADLEDKEIDGIVVNIKVACGESSVYIMTTRPELLPACFAILYHPDDERYNGKGIGKNYKIELVDGTVVIMGGLNLCNSIIKLPYTLTNVYVDEDVKMNKGTGLVIACTYGDIQDVIWRNRIHSWKNILENTIITSDGKIDLKVYGTDTRLVKIAEARIFVIQTLEAYGFLSAKKAIKHTVKCAERSGKPVEILPTEAWYVDLGFRDDILPMNDSGTLKMIAMCQKHTFKTNMKKMANAINFYPSHMKKKLLDWIDGLNQDWCISRNRFSGIPFPEDAGYNGVFDTWFISSLTPQINMGFNYGNNNEWKPMDLRPQAHEIIRTWTFYTIVKACLHGAKWNNLKLMFEWEGGVEKWIPWRNVLLSGWCLAEDKTKMSKSKGNVITPMPLIQSKGADVIRYWASTSQPGVDTTYNEAQFKTASRLLNKLRNVIKFCNIQLSTLQKNELSKMHLVKLVGSNLWLMQNLTNVVKLATGYFEDYNYCKAREVVEDFFWNIFCDNYIEMTKWRQYNNIPEDYSLNNIYIEDKNRLETIYTTCNVLQIILVCLAPIIPFLITEIKESEFKQLWLNATNYNIKDFLNKWPVAEEQYIVNNDIIIEANDSIALLINSIRSFKANKNVSVATDTKGTVYCNSEWYFNNNSIVTDIAYMCKIKGNLIKNLSLTKHDITLDLTIVNINEKIN